MTRALLALVATAALGACTVEPQGFATANAAVALDGDTFSFAGEHYRLREVDAPELPGHCRLGRHCVAGDPFASQRALQSLLDNPTTRCQREDTYSDGDVDPYGRLIATCANAWGDVGKQLYGAGYVEWYRRP